MKKSLYYYLLLTAIVAGIVLAARSQSDKPKVDTAYKSIRTYAITDIPTNDSFLIPSDTIIKRDTQKVIMLLCDTSFIKKFTSIAYFNPNIDTIGFCENRINSVWCEFGYVVTESTLYQNKISGSITGSVLIKEFLDQQKRPLKNKYVWEYRRLFDPSTDRFNQWDSTRMETQLF